MNKSPLSVGPYNIPSGHIIIPSLRSIMMGDDSWLEPLKFDPTRFYKDGKFKPDKRVIPFQLGKRACPAENMARGELFLFFVGLIQKFKFEPEKPGTVVNYRLHPGDLLRLPQCQDKIKVTRIGGPIQTDIKMSRKRSQKLSRKLSRELSRKMSQIMNDNYDNNNNEKPVKKLQ